MNRRHKTVFWIVLACLIFIFFRWLSGITMPEIATPFALGATFVLTSGLITGHSLTSLALRMGAIRSIARTIFLMSAFVLMGFVAIAFLLNAMVEKTTLFPFAVTVLLLFLVTMTASGLVTVIRHQYKSKIQSAQAAMAQSRSELQLLQSQLSPHFLFNTLNNLYGLSMSAPDRIPPLLLKLSELLRYSVYDVKEIFVPLQYEVEYIRNYIEFERLRFGSRLNLTTEIDLGFEPDCKTPPLMLIVFVENAFKHSRTTGEGTIDISLALRKREDRIVFSISNSCPEKPAPGQHQEKHSGFGLDSVRRRLGLLYPGRHTLRIDKREDQFTVHLELECQ